ncbi:MAG: alpha-amylase family glycosyl hydrolase [Planctomycetota bacterium]
MKTPRFMLIVFGLWLSADVLAVEHTFELDPTGWHEPPRRVAVAGTFNGWNKTSHPMTRSTDGVYTAIVDLPEGVHLYKFVINGEDWVNDRVYSDPELEKPDGHGGNNSAVLIGPDARTLPAPEPNRVRAEAITHQPDDFTHLSVVSRDLLLVGLMTQANDVQQVTVHTVDADGPSEHALALENSELGRDHWVGLVSVNPGPGMAIDYHFTLRDGSEALYLTPDGPAALWQRGSTEGYTVDMTPTFKTPDWAKHAVWYQIFPERFRNGDPSNDPGDMDFETLLPWTVDWWKTHTEYGEKAGQENFYGGHGNVWRRRFGGDLQGAQEALPYLRELGVNALYFNPVFEADSMHKYDASDFRHIDDNFGVKSETPHNQVEGETDDPATWGWSESDKVFLAFLEEAHAQGFKVVIDGVFNHVGKSHPFFQDVLKNGKDSRYAHWFEITAWSGERYRTHENPRGIQYVAWDGPNGHLPVFKNDPETGLGDGPRQHIFEITKRWMDPNGDGDPSDGIDGWRLDVPGDIAHPFWIEWRQLVKGINPDAYISGEIWSWAHPWLKGDQFDAVMNYQYAIPVVDFFADRDDAITPSAFARRLNRVAYSYPMQVSLVQMNLFDSHDTDRVASMFVNPDRSYDGENRPHDTGPNYDPRKPNREERLRMKQAVVNQMTFVGAPMIYYGTEAGMWAPDDPSNRMPMTWPGMEFEDPQVGFIPAVFDFYQHLIAIRHATPALRLGAFHPLITDDKAGVLVYERIFGDDRVIIAINRSAQAREILFDAPGIGGNGTDSIPVYIDLLAYGHSHAAFDPDDPDARPTLILADDVEPVEQVDGQLKLSLPAYGSAILVPTK